jgi:hypothetical protein
MRVPIKSALSPKLLFYHIKQMVVYFSALFFVHCRIEAGAVYVDVMV